MLQESGGIAIATMAGQSPSLTSLVMGKNALKTNTALALADTLLKYGRNLGLRAGTARTHLI